MSMTIHLIRIDAELHRGIVASRGQLLSALLDGKESRPGFSREDDVYRDLDYRDISLQAEDPDDPVFALFQGEPLVPGYEFTYGPPSYFSPPDVRALHEALAESADFWPFDELAAFVGRAVEEGKGLVVGVA